MSGSFGPPRRGSAPRTAPGSARPALPPTRPRGSAPLRRIIDIGFFLFMHAARLPAVPLPSSLSFGAVTCSQSCLSDWTSRHLSLLSAVLCFQSIPCRQP